MRITFDESAWPIVTITMVGASSTEEFEAYLARRARLLERGARHCTILDASRAAVPAMAQRIRQASWIRSHEQLLRRHSAGIAYVFESSAFRFVLSSIFVLSPPPSPYIVTASVDEALSWARASLVAA